MLAGCSSTLLSSRQHRFRSEACHIPTMTTQRLDIPCSLGRKDSSRSQPVIRPVGLSIEAKTSGCSLRQSIKLPPKERRDNRDEVWEKRKGIKKRFADEESCMHRVKRKRGGDEEPFWFHRGFNVETSCSGDEGKVCFVPGDVVGHHPSPLLSTIPWLDSVVTEVTGLGEMNVEPIGQEEESGSSGTSDSHGLVLGLGGNTNPVELEAGYASSPLHPSETITGIGVAGLNGENNNQTEYDCIELVGLLVTCVEQIGLKNAPAVNHCLGRLGELASPRGSPLHRLAAYFTEALALRVARVWPHIFHITIPRGLDRVNNESSGTALRLLNQVSPIPKFIHFTSNEILLRSFEGKDRIHIIDFDIKQGLQWPGLFQSLASRINPPSHIRITGVGESKQELVETGDRLAGFAEALNLKFKFHPVVDRLEDVRLWMLHVKENECVAVNSAFQLHKMLYDATRRTLHDFLGLIRSSRAEVVVMAEQEAMHNELNLNARLSNSLKYYSAIFDVIASSLPLDSTLRIKIEEMFAHEIRNIIACEGQDWIERHETFEKWQQVMEQGGFRCTGISDRELLQGQMMLNMYSCEGYGVEKKQLSGGLTLTWSDQPLYTVSAWSPVDVAGSSSLSLSQPS